jgi:hypothetical protein
MEHLLVTANNCKVTATKMSLIITLQISFRVHSFQSRFTWLRATDIIHCHMQCKGFTAVTLL